MPRRPGVWYRRTRDEWYTTFRGRQLRLGVYGVDNRQAAIEKLQQLLAELTPGSEDGGRLPERTVRGAVGEYLRVRSLELTPGALRYYRFALQTHFCKAFGDRRLGPFAAQEIQVWAARAEWSSSTRHCYLAIVGGFLRWAGFPLALKLPPVESRGADVVLTDEQFEQVLAAHGGGGDFVPLMRVLRETGARPGEVCGLTVEGVDWANGCAVIRHHKTAKKGHKRTVYFNSAAAAVMNAQRLKYQTGPLFRTSAGNPYTADELGRRARVLSKRVGFRAIPYGAGRHSFATRALCNGVPDALVAELLGHRGTAMIENHYGHVGGQSRVLREAAEKAGSKKAG